MARKQTKLIVKGKNVSVKDWLEFMQRCEAVEATKKKLKDSSKVHIDFSYTSDPALKSQRNGSKKKLFKPNADSKSDGNKFCVWCKMFILLTNAQLMMQPVNSVASKDILSGLPQENCLMSVRQKECKIEEI